MPHYSFEITDGQESLQDATTVDLPGPAAARDEAVRLARTLQQGEPPSDDGWDGWFVAVKDDHGQQVETVPIADVEG